MEAVFLAAWNAMEEYTKSRKNIKIDIDKKDSFIDGCMNLYRSFSKEYMRDGNKTLDRHKIGSAISIIGSSDDYIESSVPIKDGEFFLGRYSIPVVIALSFIEQDIEVDLRSFKFIKKNESMHLHIPDPSSCNTKYIDVIARMLRFEEKKQISNTLRMVELSNTFFLIEECSLLKLGINMNKWVKFKREQK